MNRLLIAAVALLLLGTSVCRAFVPADDDTTAYSLGLYGFVRNDFTLDTRASEAVVSELFYLRPYDRRLDDAGQDLNYGFRARYLAITTRVGLNFESPLYHRRFRFSANLEADFCGGAAPTVAVLLLRRANMTFDWLSPLSTADGTEMHHRLLCGQAFHPLTSELLPDIVSINTGAPFNPYARTPQIRYTAVFPSVRLTAAAVWQFQYASPGPEGISAKYQNNAAVPEAFLGVEYRHRAFRVGTGAEFISIRPRLAADYRGQTLRVREHANSWASQLYIAANDRHWDFRAKTVYGENVSHLLMMSGYGVVDKRYDGPEVEYAPLRQSSTWATLTYHTDNIDHNVYATILGGYMKNLGSARPLSEVYVRGADNIDQMWRASAVVQYRFRELQVGLEYECTAVDYGTPRADYTVGDTHSIINHRLTATVVYNFGHTWKFRKQ